MSPDDQPSPCPVKGSEERVFQLNAEQAATMSRTPHERWRGGARRSVQNSQQPVDDCMGGLMSDDICERHVNTAVRPGGAGSVSEQEIANTVALRLIVKGVRLLIACGKTRN